MPRIYLTTFSKLWSRACTLPAHAVYCSVRSSRGYMCTREPGHDGGHIAHISYPDAPQGAELAQDQGVWEDSK